MASVSCVARFQCPIFALSTRPPTTKPLGLTSNSRPSTTASRISPKRSVQASPSTPAHRTRQICAAYWSSEKSLRRFSVYEHPSQSRRIAHGVWVHRAGGSISLCSSDALRLLHTQAVPALYGRTPWETFLCLRSENPEQRSRLGS